MVETAAARKRAVSGYSNWIFEPGSYINTAYGLRGVARRIARSLAVELLPEHQAALSRKGTGNEAAYEAYLKGRYFWNRRTEEGFAKAVGYFEQAIREDENYALAHAGLADAYNTLGIYGGVPPRVARQRASLATARALEIDRHLAEAHTALAYTKMLFEWDWAGSEKEFLTAIELNPTYETARHYYAHLLTVTGRFDEALEQMEVTLKLDPLSMVLNSVKGWLFYYARRFEQSEKQLRKTLEIDIGFGLTNYFLGLTYLRTGRLSEAIEQFERADQVSGGHPALVAGLGQAFALQGRTAEACGVVKTLDETSTQRYSSPYMKVGIYAALGQVDEAFQELDKAYRERSGWMTYINVDPALDPMRTDQRFRRLLLALNHKSAGR